MDNWNHVRLPDPWSGCHLHYQLTDFEETRRLCVCVIIIIL
jgi:hypothetical protein